MKYTWVGNGVTARRVKDYNLYDKRSMTNKQDVYIEEWKSLPWREFEKTLFHLQHRLYKASFRHNKNEINRLQSLILGSASSRYLAVRQIIKLNVVKKTVGGDSLASLNYKQRLELANDLKDLKSWKHQPIRRVFIQKPNVDQRPLRIPTLRDQAMQCLLKYSLEPVYEAQASNGGWGFRPGQCTHDVQKIIFLNLKYTANGYKKSILALDIEKCFDKIDHEKFLSLVILPESAKKVVKSALKAGVLKERIKTPQGTRQKNFILPLLCNIALNGIEDLHNEVIGLQSRQRGIRYANDILFFLNEGEDLEKLRNKLDLFLAERGLNLKESKIQFVKSIEGFDFLGWHFKVKQKNNKFVCYPSKKNRARVFKKIKLTLRDTRSSIEERLSKVKVIYHEWWDYHQYCDMLQVNTWSMSKWVYRYLTNKTSLSKNLKLEKIREIFNGHIRKVNGYRNLENNRSPFDKD
jgi:group II intron reverse transcriptase/maturase